MNEFKISWVAHTTLETTAIPHLRNLSVQRFLKYASHVLENRSKTPVRPQEGRLGVMFYWWPPAGLGENDCFCLVCQHFCDYGDYSNFQKIESKNIWVLVQNGPQEGLDRWWQKRVSEQVSSSRKLMDCRCMSYLKPLRKRLRLVAYSIRAVSLVAIGSNVKVFGGVDNAQPVIPWRLTTSAAIFVVLVVFDSVYHAITKTDMSCIRCGGSPRTQSFCVVGECPHWGT